MRRRSKVLLASFVLVAASGTVALAWLSPRLKAPIFVGRVGEEICQWLGGKWEAYGTNASLVPVTPRVIAAFGFIRACGVATLERATPSARFIFGSAIRARSRGIRTLGLTASPTPSRLTAIIENGVLTSVNCLLSPKERAQGGETLAWQDI